MICISMPMKCILRLCVVSFILLAGDAFAIELSGPAKIKDGDTLAVGTQVVRLAGVDAFENSQNCNSASGRRYNCGAKAENFIKSLTRGGVVCSGTVYDRYDRLIAHCQAGGVDVGEAMVSNGYALAYRKYSSEYVSVEIRARASAQGAWAGSFIPPWEYRAARWSAAAQETPSPDCPIKGNINRKGERIYHAPWSRSNKRTKVNTAKGEKWFCDEAEALSAGWRAPYR